MLFYVSFYVTNSAESIVFISLITCANETSVGIGLSNSNTRFVGACNQWSVRLSVRLSNAYLVTKRKKNVSRFLYH